MTLIEGWDLYLWFPMRDFFGSKSCHFKIFSFWSDEHDFVNCCIIYFLFLSFIAKRLAMCQLGGVITTQKVHYYKLKVNCIKHFGVVVRPLYPIWHVKNLASVTNQFLVSFSVFGSFLDHWNRPRLRESLEHMKNPSFGALQNPLANLERDCQSY